MPTSISINGAAFLLLREGWSDKNASGGKGTKGKGATAHKTFDGKVTVGPGLTDSLNKSVAASKPIVDGQAFTGEELCLMYRKSLDKFAARLIEINPNLGKTSQRAFDMAVSMAYNCGEGGWSKHAKNAVTEEDFSLACANGPKSSKGKTLSSLVSRRKLEAAISVGKRCDGTRDETAASNMYYNPSGVEGDIAKKYFSGTVSSSTTTTTTKLDESKKEAEETAVLPAPAKPEIPAGIVLENWYGNAYTNILGYDSSTDSSTRMVQHTRIYALFESKLILDELSRRIDFGNGNIDKEIEEEAIANIQQNEGGTEVSSNTIQTLLSDEEILAIEMQDNLRGDAYAGDEWLTYIQNQT